MNTRPPTSPAASARQKSSSSPIASSQQSNSSPQQASMASGTKSARGTSASVSRPSGKVAEADKPARPSSKDSLKSKMPKKLEETPRPNKSEEQLKAFKTDFDGLRALVTCKICDKLLYEPYIISCGHTYCYSCLCTWFVSNKARKTCPDCRAVVAQAPAPAYVIREMTLIFINRAELLPAGETIEQHTKWQKEESDIVQQDKNNTDTRTGGLFKGCFKSRTGGTLRPIRDEEDGVDRCPMCSWELEDGECAQCGLMFDDNGTLTWGDSFGGFSDMDETSEHDMSGEDLEGEIDMEDGFDDYGDGAMDEWQDYLDDGGSFMMRRFLEHGIPTTQHFQARRRRMTHSEAGSRRPSYSASIVSDMLTDEMDTVEEEDEEDVDDGDSSMNDFIDEEGETEGGSQSTTSTPGQTPQPQPAPRLNRRPRRIVESETSSNISQVPEEDEEEEGPIPNGLRRQHYQARLLSRANGSRRTASSTSTETSAEHELDEDTQALLHAAGWSPLDHDGPEDGMDEDDDSDGGRTTVGWDATAISNDRSRIGGSLTPTADRPNAPIRPPSRVGSSRPGFPDGSRGLRRRSSVLSTTSTVHYEDGEADDDDSEPDHDGDVTMAMNALRARRSRVQMRNGVLPNSTPSRFANHGLSQGVSIDLDTDDNSDTSQQPVRRRQTARAREQEYDPRISWMFASHQAALRDSERSGAPYDHLDQLRSTTPIARPRTANRNRAAGQASPAPPFSPSNGLFSLPGNVPSRLRTPTMDSSSNHGVSVRGSPSQSNRSGVSVISSMPEGTSRNNGGALERSTPVGSISGNSAVTTPTTAARSNSQPTVNSISQATTAAAVDMIDRPPSRVSSRPPSAAGRRNSAGFVNGFPGLSAPVGLNFGARVFQVQARNPWAPYVHPQNVVRTRTSRPTLRDQSSVATLRASNSRQHLRNQPSQVSIRDSVNSPQTIRPQASRMGLRHNSSQRRLNSQVSTRTLRASEHAQPPQSPVNTPSVAAASAVRPRFSEDERLRLARELISNRARELGTNQPSTAQPGANQPRTNPFTAGARRPSIPNRDSPSAPTDVPATNTAGMNSPSHTRTGSNESLPSSAAHSPTASNASSQHPPNLNRRRSNRNIAALPGVFSPTQASFSPTQTTFANSYVRSRSGPLPGSPAYESPINTNPRGMSPMVAAGDRARY